MANVKFSVNAGLHNDYGIFNLSQAAVNKIKLDFVVNAESFVDNDNSEYMHGNTSAYKEFEGIQPQCANIADWGSYGQNFAQILRHYMQNKIDGYLPPSANDEDVTSTEIYCKIGGEYFYPNYKNQFSLDFYGADDPNLQAYGDSADRPFRDLSHDLNTDKNKFYSNYKYQNYREDVRTFSDKKIKTVGLAEAQSGTYLTVQAIHFSKYYPLYSITSGIEKTLQPLLYNSDDLARFNLGLYNDIPAMRSMVTFDYYRCKVCGTFSCDRKERLFLCASGWNSGNNRYSGPSQVSGYDKETHGGHGWSNFKNGSIKGMPWIDAVDTSSIQPGFSAFAFTGTHSVSYTINKIRDAALPSDYTKTFTDLVNYSHVLQPYYKGTDGVGYSVRSIITMSIIYKQDSASNFHIFNTWFPVKGDAGGCSQEIFYTTSAKKLYPPYVGQILASILANIYVYKESQNNSINYISDMIYLSDNGTLYTKDMPFRMYMDSSNNDYNDCLLVRKQKFGNYVNKLKEFINHEDEKWEQNISDNNVTVKFREMVKNQPIQFRLNYIGPDISYIGLQSYVLLKKLDGKSQRMLSDIVKSDKMYQVDDNNRISYLNENFTIKWINKLTLDENNELHAELYDNLPTYNIKEICKVFSYRNGAFDMETTSISSTTPTYLIHSNKGLDNTMYNFVASDILFPPARLA